ncbi:D-lactate dehydrogenase [Arthrobacter sp. TPD3018]|uniref:D-lactate dehydrogenase n=1 Tax=Bacteria TaxID=2 RepID=UPI000D509261|nr:MULTISPECIES: D-lactate dehydrogenase [Bacteria]PVE52026.1 D-lactate dehydrogenase [Arthrobacter sp. TPD3018]PVE54384.1 D-lactate dehydrogenase [Sphingomonas sp. TPD3009]PVE82798.1 D-lactate dehydrogenase [Sphingomonas melonis]
MTGTATLLATLRAIVGRRHLLTSPRATARFRKGYRTGDGPAIAVVQPASLVELWRVAQACVAADVSIIMQASNTGLTGGSTPDGDDYPGGLVIISTTRLSRLRVIRGGEQVVCLPGATLHDLEQTLRPYGREPHSVIGSSCFGASVVGGVCNNSGGSLIRRGPAYTQLALFAAVRPDGGLTLLNHLGISLGDDPVTILSRLDAGDFTEADVEATTDRWAHDHSYADHVRAIDSDMPARFNADPRCLFEASGSAGKLIVFAVRLDTFAREEDSATFYIGTNDPDRLTDLRRTILRDFDRLPIAGEYIHRTAFDVADRYGRDTFLAIERMGTHRLPALFAAKARFDAVADRVSKGLGDRLMQWSSRFMPDHLPGWMRAYRDRFAHHLILKVSGDQLDATRALLARLFPDDAVGDHRECSAADSAKAFLHRFVVAGAAVRYRAVHVGEVADIVALDVALPRNAQTWVEDLPSALGDQVIHALYYGHFFCHVFHQDYIVRRGSDPLAFEHALWALLDARGAQYPAEHNVGHLYAAPPQLADFYRDIDPRNQLNPGIGQTPRARHWADRDGSDHKRANL